MTEKSREKKKRDWSWLIIAIGIVFLVGVSLLEGFEAKERENTVIRLTAEIEDMKTAFDLYPVLDSVFKQSNPGAYLPIKVPIVEINQPMILLCGNVAIRYFITDEDECGFEFRFEYTQTEGEPIINKASAICISKKFFTTDFFYKKGIDKNRFLEQAALATYRILKYEEETKGEDK